MTYEIISTRKLRQKVTITGPEDVYQVVKRYTSSKQEHFVVLTLSGANEIISITINSIGSLTRTVIHPREIFKKAILDSAAGIIVSHTHPSGSLNPSEEDIEGTKRLEEAGKLIGIPVLDHLVCSSSGFTSMKNLGIIS